METPHHPHSEKGSPFWHLVSNALGLLFGLAALLLGGFFIAGAIKASNQKGDPAPPASPLVAPVAGAAAGAPASGNTASSENGLTAITIKPGSPNPMSYDTPTFTVKSGKLVKITFANQNTAAPLPHNFCLCQIGSKEAMFAEANKMMTDPNGMNKGFIPDTPLIIAHTKLLQPGQTETIEFTAGPKGDYPYMCTFPGHSIIMNGVMKVE